MDGKELLKRAKEWPDDPRAGHWIDDGALYVLMVLGRGMYAKVSSNTFTLTALRPTEWGHTDILKFLIRASEEYDFPLTNHAVMTYVIAEDYEVPTYDKEGNVDPEYEEAWTAYSEQYREYEKCRKQYEHLQGRGMKQCRDKFPMPPKKYGGAYKWALGRVELKETEQDKMLARFFDGTFDTADVKMAIRFADTPVPDGIAEDSEELYSKQICTSLIEWTSFDANPEQEKGLQIQLDLKAYLTRFIEGTLEDYSRNRHIRGTFVSINPNIYTFEKHTQMLAERFKAMYTDYGNTFVFENPFDEVELDLNDMESVRQLYARRQFLFMHALFAFEQLGYIQIQRIGDNWDWRESKTPRSEAKVTLLDRFAELVDKRERLEGLSFDPDTSRLHVRGNDIPIRKFSDQFHTLRVIFEKPEDTPKEWFFSELVERIDPHKTGDKRYYNAAYQIREKLAKEGFPDFIITTKQSLKVNPKYLS